MSHESFTAPTLELLAELLPAYDFESFIAQGGMGAVYKARQRSLDRDVAIKILPRELGADPEFRQSFVTEAKAMARLNHPNLIGVYDFGDADGMPFIVMEYVHGKSLYHSAWNQSIEPAQAVAIVKAICEGLAHANAQGIIHGDIKPANILMTPDVVPKIGDFGLARPSDDVGPGLAMGTPGYTAPEVFNQPDLVDARADLYSVGVILHELLTGKTPDASGYRDLVSSGDLRLDAIWQKATQDSPDHRYQSAAEMAAALASWKPGPRIALAAGARPAPRATAAGGARPPAPVSTKLHAQKKGVLVRNLFIIAALLLAIFVTHQTLESTKRQRASEQAILDRQNEEKKAAALESRKREAEESARREQTRKQREAELVRLRMEQEAFELAAREAEEEKRRNDAMAAAPAQDPSFAPTPEIELKLTELDKMLPGLLENELINHRKALVANLKDLSWKLDSTVSRMGKQEATQWKLLITEFEALVEDHRMPDPSGLEDELSAKPSDKLEEIFSFHFKKQDEIDRSYLAKLVIIRDAYAKRLNDAASEADRLSNKAYGDHIRFLASNCADLEPWLESHGVELPGKEEPEVETVPQSDFPLFEEYAVPAE